MKQKPDRVHILGLGSTWKLAPSEGEVWGLNRIVEHRPVRLIFSMHPLDYWLVDTPNGMEIVDKINELEIPVLTVEKEDRWKRSALYPLEKMLSRYFTNSFAYMIAYALYKKYKKIDLYGCPLAMKEEYREQRPCIEFWLGMAVGKGVEVTLHGESMLFNSGLHAGLYGYEWNQHYQTIPK